MNATSAGRLLALSTLLALFAPHSPVASAADFEVAGSLRFSSTTFTVGEGHTMALITVMRVGGDDGAVSVAYSTTDGTATAGSDYLATSGTLTWPDNDDNLRTFMVPILDDVFNEGNETVNLMLTNPGGGATVGMPAQATLTIIDNDPGGPPPGPGGVCTPDTTTLCLFSGRFSVTVFFRRPGTPPQGFATVDQREDQWGTFFFFANSNIPNAMVTMGPRPNGFLAVQIPPLQAAELEVTIFDHETETTQVYTKPQGNLELIIDPAAFPQ